MNIIILEGAIRFVFKSSPIQLTTDYNVAPCNDGICEEGETCRACPADCGVCPPPVCGDGICEEGESYLTCSNDCSNELPGCERFNDESNFDFKNLNFFANNNNSNIIIKVVNREVNLTLTMD